VRQALPELMSITNSVAVGLMLASLSLAQLQKDSPQPAFEVASVKPVALSAPGCNELAIRAAERANAIESARYSVPCSHLKALITWAYDLKDVPIEGGPKWIDSPDFRFEVEATAGSFTTVAQKRLMLQELLADRFQLKLHREKQMRPVFVLVVAKGGSKLHDTLPADPHGQVRFGMQGKTKILTGAGSRMSDLVPWVRSIVPERPIVDETGLTGAYDFKLEWLPDADQPTVAFFSAIQDQLGLKVEDRKSPMDVLIVDSVDKPLPNQ
jgi:uncharacterized protein (TIGR03435 family)